MKGHHLRHTDRHAASSGAAFACVLALAAVLAPGVLAQNEPPPEALAQARERFGEGIAMSDSGNWAEAAVAFREVFRVIQAPAVLFNLAHALVEINEFSEADELLTRMLADESTPDDLRSRGVALQRRMDRYGGRLTVQLSGGNDQVHVILDGRELPEASIGEALRVRQGTHRLLAEAYGRNVGRAEMYVGRRARRTVDVVVDASALQAAEAAHAARTGPQVPDVPDTPDGPDAPDVEPPVTDTERPRISPEDAANANSELPPGAVVTGTDTVLEEERSGANWRLIVGIAAGVIAVGAGIAIGVALSGGSDTPTGFEGDFNPGTVRF